MYIDPENVNDNNNGCRRVWSEVNWSCCFSSFHFLQNHFHTNTLNCEDIQFSCRSPSWLAECNNKLNWMKMRGSRCTNTAKYSDLLSLLPFIEYNVISLNIKTFHTLSDSSHQLPVISFTCNHPRIFYHRPDDVWGWTIYRANLFLSAIHRRYDIISHLMGMFEIYSLYLMFKLL